jgi:CHAD domain-containing protein
MKNKASTNYLTEYYESEVDSFLVRLYKSKISPDEKNIHQLRVDIKRIKAVFQLLEIIVPKKLDLTFNVKAFKKLFKNAGKVREIQVNRTCFSKYKFSEEITDKYKQFLKNREELFRKRFKKTAKNFERDSLKSSKIKIKKIWGKLNDKKIWIECVSFIKGETQKIEQLLSLGNNPAIIHRMRMHIKSLHTIVSLLHKIKPTKEFEKILLLIKQNDILIGDWHDRQVLIDSIERSFIKNENINENKLPALIKTLNKIEEENKFFFKRLKNQVNIITITIHKTYFRSL